VLRNQADRSIQGVKRGNPASGRLKQDPPFPELDDYHLEEPMTRNGPSPEEQRTVGISLASGALVGAIVGAAIGVSSGDIGFWVGTVVPVGISVGLAAGGVLSMRTR
jgi:hypothetical protein